MRGGTYSLESNPKARFFEKFFMAILFTLGVFARNQLRESRLTLVGITIYGLLTRLLLYTYVNFDHEWRVLQLKVNVGRKLFMVILFTLRFLPEIC